MSYLLLIIVFVRKNIPSNMKSKMNLIFYKDIYSNQTIMIIFKQNYNLSIPFPYFPFRYCVGDARFVLWCVS